MINESKVLYYQRAIYTTQSVITKASIFFRTASSSAANSFASVGVILQRHFNLRDSARFERDVSKPEHAQEVLTFRELTFAFEDLVVRGSREAWRASVFARKVEKALHSHLRLLGW